MLSELMPSIVWGPGGKILTPEEIAQARAIEQEAASQAIDTSPVGHPTQGMARVANAIAGAFRRGNLDEAQAANDAYAASQYGDLRDDLGGIGDPYPVEYQESPLSTSEEAQFVKSGLMARGMPEHVADGFVMNMIDESGLNPNINEHNPLVPGSRGGFGYYQATGPRRVGMEQAAMARGVAPGDRNNQLDYLAYEMAGPEAAAAQHIMAAPDKWTAAAEIAKRFLRPSPEHLERRVNKYLSGRTQGGIQTASLDPSIGMDIALNGGPERQNTAYDALVNPAKYLGNNQEAAGVPVAQAVPQGQVVSDAPPMRVAQVQPRQSQRRGPSNELLIRAMSDPRAPESTKRIAKTIYDRRVAEHTEQMRRQQRLADEARTREAARQQFMFEQEYRESLPSAIAQREDMRLKQEDMRLRQDREARKEAQAESESEKAAKTAENLVRSTTNNIVDTARKARQALKGKLLPATGVIGSMIGSVSGTSAHEIRKQTRVLKSFAKMETLQTLRNSSKTGSSGLGPGASDAEQAMMEDKAGALDPNSPYFERDLNDYERSLLQIIHGPEEGERIFLESRDLPEGVTEADLEYTMKLNNMTRSQVMKRLLYGS